MRLRLTFAALLLLVLSAQAVAGVRVSGVRAGDNDDRTRVVLDLSAAPSHSSFTLTNPDRFVLDIANADLSAVLNSLPANVGVVREVRGANREGGSARLVLETSGPASATVFTIPPTASKGHRLVIDLTGTGIARPSEAVVAAAPPAEPVTPEPVLRPAPAALPEPANPRPLTAVRAMPVVQRELVIAVDAGHGGKDPGALSANGLKEKDVVLKIARRLADAIDREPGMRAVLTRRDDTFVPLRNRMERARSAQADLFISVHADAVENRSVRGSSVYVLSNKGASDEASRRLAQRENQALIGGVALGGHDEELAGVLLDLSQNAALSASLEFGDEVLSELGTVGIVRKKRVQQAPFLVLKSPDIPSILVETAFISNAQDARNLASSGFQRKVAAAVLSGVRDYFAATMPDGARFASAQEGGDAQTHRITSGDTLSSIAGQYRVSVAQLRSANNLNSDRIQTGRVLRIP